MAQAIPRMMRLMLNMTIFFGDENHCPLFMTIQKMEGRPSI
jgi:hypothetical protein